MSRRGLAFASRAEAESLLERPKATVPQAVLHSVKLNEQGVQVPVQARDASGKLLSLQRFLYQTGTGEVKCDTSSIQKGGQVTARTVKAVVTVNQSLVPANVWERCITRDPEKAVREWLLLQQIKVLEVQPSRAYANGTMRLVVRLSMPMATAMMKICGRDGMITTRFIESDADRSFFATIPLDETREKALERAAFHGAEVWGVVPQRNGKGWGVRVVATEYERFAKVIRPTDYQQITGEVYELSGFPTWMGEEGLAEFLAPGNTIAQFRGTTTYGWNECKRRNFFVKTTEKIAWTKKQGEDFVATCGIEVRKPRRTEPVQSFRQNKKIAQISKLETEPQTWGGPSSKHPSAAIAQTTPAAPENMMQMLAGLIRSELSAKFGLMAGKFDQLLSRLEYLEAVEGEEQSEDEDMQEGTIEAGGSHPTLKQTSGPLRPRRLGAGKAKSILNKFVAKG